MNPVLLDSTQVSQGDIYECSIGYGNIIAVTHGRNLRKPQRRPYAMKVTTYSFLFDIKGSLYIYEFFTSDEFIKKYKIWCFF